MSFSHIVFLDTNYILAYVYQGFAKIKSLYRMDRVKLIHQEVSPVACGKAVLSFQFSLNKCGSMNSIHLNMF